MEHLESRLLFDSAYANVNVSRLPGNHAEGTIVADPRDVSRLFAASNAPGVGLLAATSGDGGATWTRRTIGTDAVDDGSGIAAACCDPSAAFDRFGNLYLTYAREDDRGVEVVLSTDAGATFRPLAGFDGELDQPTIATGGDAAWVTFKRGNAVAAAGASASGLGVIAPFGEPANLPGSRGGNFGDVAVGPRGQVAVTYQAGLRIGISVDPDGLGPAPFGRKVIATTTKVSGFDRIPAQEPRGIDAEADLEYDRSPGPFNGRLYLLYTDEQPDGSDNTDVVLRYSADDGRTWVAPARVNSDVGLSSQFLPRMALDDATGDLGFAWHDTRDDAGPGSPADTNAAPNDDALFFVARARPVAEGVLFSQDAQVSRGASNADASRNSIDLGDYVGLAFVRGTLHPLWADNSNSTGDNPDGRLNTLDLYTAAVPAASLPEPARRALGNLPGAARALFSPARAASLGGKPDYRFRVTYAAGAGIDPTSVDDADLLVTGPGGYSVAADLLSVRRGRRGSIIASYAAPAPLGRWTGAHAGTYTIALRPAEVRDAAGGAFPEGVVGWFAVRTGLSAVA